MQTRGSEPDGSVGAREETRGKKRGGETESGKNERKARQTAVPYLPLICGHEDLLSVR